jgi:hypothetical protein
MATKKKAAAKTTAAKKPAAPKGGPSIHDPYLTQEQLPDDGSGPEPHEINSALASPRMKSLLKDHREMGSRP